MRYTIADLKGKSSVRHASNNRLLGRSGSGGFATFQTTESAQIQRPSLLLLLLLFSSLEFLLLIYGNKLRQQISLVREGGGKSGANGSRLARMRSPFLTYKFPRGIAKSLNCSFCSRNYYDKFVAKREEFVGKVCSLN